MQWMCAPKVRGLMRGHADLHRLCRIRLCAGFGSVQDSVQDSRFAQECAALVHHVNRLVPDENYSCRLVLILCAARRISTSKL